MIVAVQIDSREPAWVQELRFGDAPVAVSLLEAGDVWIATDDALVVIERKTSSDLLGTIGANRLLDQGARTRAISPWAYLVITGDLHPGADGKTLIDRQPTGWSWHAIQGALLSMQELGVQVVHLADDAAFLPGILWLAQRNHESSALIMPMKVADFLTPQERILCALPGIGAEMARRILEHCGSAAVALQYLSDMTGDNGHVAGVGAVTKTKCRKALGLEPWAEMTIISTEHKLLTEKELF
jgi:ERCC4-type nuclease